MAGDRVICMLLRMFNDICPDVFRWLRERSGLTQEQLGRELAASKSTVHSWESGRSRLSPQRERDLLDVVQWPKESWVELVCEKLSLYLGRRVTIMPAVHERYRPTTPLAKAEALIRTHYSRIPERLRNVLQNRVASVRSNAARLERENLELQEITVSCLGVLGIAADEEVAA